MSSYWRTLLFPLVEGYFCIFKKHGKCSYMYILHMCYLFINIIPSLLLLHMIIVLLLTPLPVWHRFYFLKMATPIYPTPHALPTIWVLHSSAERWALCFFHLNSEVPTTMSEVILCFLHRYSLCVRPFQKWQL